jgi:hypothetical protein
MRLLIEIYPPVPFRVAARPFLKALSKFAFAARIDFIAVGIRRGRKLDFRASTARSVLGFPSASARAHLRY